ncbi:cytochrome c-type biogenesis protein CcmH [Azorhizobium oxalatiphilum]|uniref:Cytochrome c-type biogenesis protein n=1 Tax=Azorhizobium oxalatiphilum TaxID=980631 RepID=A0A917F6V3_9HYPH|nr:cytochrome c-type biogenesis protein [Azorhizobium oxalatiphilum]GGF53346.1 cytochrome c-type biogenesis protein CcmH [Azorhizobium oxalatiphilum]
MTFLRRLACVLLLLVSVGPAFAVQPDEVLSNPALEARARTLSKELRCMVCQNQSIDDSDAPLARDLRILVRERLAKGDSDRQVLDFLVARYGEFVLLRPTFSARNALLWSLPFIVLVVGGIAAFMAFRGRSQTDVQQLTPEEEARLRAILAANGETGAETPPKGGKPG